MNLCPLIPIHAHRQSQKTTGNVYGDLLAQHQPKAIETEAENEAQLSWQNH